MQWRSSRYNHLVFYVPTNVINFAEKFEFKNPATMDDKQCKQTEQFSKQTNL